EYCAGLVPILWVLTRIVKCHRRAARPPRAHKNTNPASMAGHVREGGGDLGSRSGGLGRNAPSSALIYASIRGLDSPRGPGAEAEQVPRRVVGAETDRVALYTPPSSLWSA